MLNPETCKRLCKAGLNQNCSELYYAPLGKGGKWIPTHAEFVPTGVPWTACPNSDELIAAIISIDPEHDDPEIVVSCAFVNWRNLHNCDAQLDVVLAEYFICTKIDIAKDGE